MFYESNLFPLIFAPIIFITPRVCNLFIPWKYCSCSPM